MSLEKAIENLTMEVIALRVVMHGANVPSPYDEIPSDSEPQPEPEVTPKPKPKKEKPAPKEEVEKTSEPEDPLLEVQKTVTELSKRDREAAKKIVSGFVPDGSPVKLSSVPDSDYEALIAAVKEALGG